MHEFATAAHEMLLFTRNVRKVSVLVVEPGQQRAKLLGKVRDCMRSLGTVVVGVIANHYLRYGSRDESGCSACQPQFPGTSSLRWSRMRARVKRCQHTADE